MLDLNEDPDLLKGLADDYTFETALANLIVGFPNNFPLFLFFIFFGSKDIHLFIRTIPCKMCGLMVRERED